MGLLHGIFTTHISDELFLFVLVLFKNRQMWFFSLPLLKVLYIEPRAFSFLEALLCLFFLRSSLKGGLSHCSRVLKMIFMTVFAVEIAHVQGANSSSAILHNGSSKNTECQSLKNPLHKAPSRSSSYTCTLRVMERGGKLTQ